MIYLHKIRVIVCILIIVMIFGVFTKRLFQWQITDKEIYLQMSSYSEYTIKTPAIRGEIFDRNGIPLAVNENVYNVVIDKLYITPNTENTVIAMLMDIFKSYNETWIDKLPININNNKYTFSEDFYSFEDIGISGNYTADKFIDILADRYNCYENDKILQRNIISVRYNMEKRGYSMSTSYTFAENISQELLAAISEKTQNINGIRIERTLSRQYPNGIAAPHIVGNIGSISQEEYTNLKDNGYSLNDKIGKFGIEKAMEEYLRGTNGKKIITRDKKGNIEVIDTENSVAGNNIYLTIDTELQSTALKSLEENINNARQSGYSDCIAGAAVMLDVNDFSILSAVSYPSYDLELYTKNSEYYSQLMNDNTTPIFNRAFSGKFAPGSIFKPLVAMSSLQENIIDKDSIVCCSKYYHNGSFTLRCMGIHGYINLQSALAKSCNYFFADVGNRLGIDKMNMYAKQFGLGVYTGVEIGETKGILAGKENSQKYGQEWYSSDTICASIGQSDNAFSPLQLAVYTATIANGGTRYQAHLVNNITDYTTGSSIYKNNISKSVIVNETDIDQENINIVKSGMRECVLTGTASYVFGNYPIEISAKTGTAENSGSDHTTFICFAPSENPQVAIAVVIEHGAKGIYSMNVAKSLLDCYFNL